MSPQLVSQFWKTVRRKLVAEHNFPQSTAQALIRQYRKRLISHRIGDAVYNRGEDSAVATIVAAGKAGGFQKPVYSTV